MRPAADVNPYLAINPLVICLVHALTLPHPGPAVKRDSRLFLYYLRTADSFCLRVGLDTGWGRGRLAMMSPAVQSNTRSVACIPWRGSRATDRQAILRDGLLLIGREPVALKASCNQSRLALAEPTGFRAGLPGSGERAAIEPIVRRLDDSPALCRLGSLDGCPFECAVAAVDHRMWVGRSRTSISRVIRVDTVPTRLP